MEINNEGNEWGLMNFDDNDNGGSETSSGGLMELKWGLKKMRRRRIDKGFYVKTKPFCF